MEKLNQHPQIASREVITLENFKYIVEDAEERIKNALSIIAGIENGTTPIDWIEGTKRSLGVAGSNLDRLSTRTVIKE